MGDAAAEAPEGLLHLEADIVAAEHDQMRGKPIKLERLAWVSGAAPAIPGISGMAACVPRLRKTRSASRRRVLQQLNFNTLGRNEATLAKNEFQTVRRQPRLVDRNQAIDYFTLVLSHASHVQGPGTKAQSECRRMANELHDLPAVDHVLAGKAVNTRTGTTDQSLLDHGNAMPASRQLPGDVLAGLPAA
jgi:hypothetical protein